MRASKSPENKRLYTRALSSGGYVAIEAEPVRTLFGPVKIRGRVVVERRSEARRVGHNAPVAAVAEHSRVRDIIHALFPIAHSDRAIEQVLARNIVVNAVAGRKREIGSESD